MLQSAGSLATTHEVLDRIDRDLATRGDHESLATVDHLFEAALYVGRLSREVAARAPRPTPSEPTATATFILGGQIAGERPDILLVYPEGNYIRASDDRAVPADRRDASTASSCSSSPCAPRSTCRRRRRSPSAR